MRLHRGDSPSFAPPLTTPYSPQQTELTPPIMAGLGDIVEEL